MEPQGEINKVNKEPPSIPKSASVKNSLLLVMSLLLIFTATLAAFFYIQIQKLSKEVAKSQVRPTPVATATPDPTANWQTYVNEKYGFSFKYPEGYIIKESVPELMVLALSTEDATQNGISVDARIKNPYDSLTNAQNHLKKTLDLTVNTKMADWFIFQGVGKEGTIKGVELRHALIPYQTGVINVETAVASPYAEVFDQILSTFKFLEKNEKTNHNSLGGCQYNGATYKNGETFSEKCNSCACTMGKVVCTMMACP